MISSKNFKFLKLINMDSLIRNSIVVVICVLGMTVSLLFIRHDLKNGLQDPGNKPVGTVYWVTNNVKRLSVRRVQWERLERLSSVFDGDIISSDTFSEVKIGFTGGENLEISPNSSVRVIYHDLNAIRIMPREGEMLIKSSRKSLIVSLADITPFETAISDLRISFAPGTITGIKAPGKNTLDGFALKVYQGSGTFISKGVSRTIETGEVLKLGNDGFVLAELSAIMLAPLNGTRIFQTSQGNVPIEFEWKQLDQSGGNVLLEVSKSRDFSVLEGSWNGENMDSSDLRSADLQSAVIELSEGTHYWKLYDASSREEADSGRLDIIRTQEPKALSPADGAIVTIRPGKQELRFYWAVPEEADAVMFEVADNPEMENPRIQRIISRTARGRGSYDISDLETGRWYWQVCPVFSGKRDNPSPVNSFVIEESMELTVQKTAVPVPVVKFGNIPDLIFPPDNYTLEANRTPDLLFTWRNNISNNARFQVSELSDFSGSLIMDNEVSGTNMQGPFLVPGVYYWRIANPDPEVPERPSRAGASDQSIEGLISSAGNSHPNRLVIMPGLPSPQLVAPAENERLIIQDGVAVKFEWNQVNYANYYQFNLFLQGREIPLRGISSLHNDSIYVYFDPNTQGQFTWTIQGFTSPTETTTGRNGLIARGHFGINPDIYSTGTDQISWTIPRIANMQAYAGEVDSPIKLMSPSQGINIPGIQALRSPPEARWVSDVPLMNVQLIVSRTTDPSSDPRSIVRNVNETSVTFPSLSEGVWYWIIRGDTSELRGTTPGDPFWFNVLPIPLLPVPHPVQPESKSIIGLAQLTRDRNITFQWNSVEGANAYIFSLYQDDTTPKLLFTAPPQTALSYIFENLSIFGNGDYFWQIEAVYRDRNGVIEQRGGTGQYPFSIEIQRSANLRTIPQGTLYGQ